MTGKVFHSQSQCKFLDISLAKHSRPSAGPHSTNTLCGCTFSACDTAVSPGGAVTNAVWKCRILCRNLSVVKFFLRAESVIYYLCCADAQL